ncbi:unnamed protein product [Polarella glacialis]|uniref:Apple domain-containing protein n=1 Tax=Polarella glacialis TaxID=89957 RepID=A0A813M7M5_POLGL|nr:unnamed protein product [Polarella glacialis]
MYISLELQNKNNTNNNMMGKQFPTFLLSALALLFITTALGSSNEWPNNNNKNNNNNNNSSSNNKNNNKNNKNNNNNNCVFQSDTDWSPSTWSLGTARAKSPEECCDACAQTAGCTIAPFFRGLCYLKADIDMDVSYYKEGVMTCRPVLAKAKDTKSRSSAASLSDEVPEQPTAAAPLL